MPELPDIALYVETLRERIAGHTLQRVLIRGPFFLRSAAPPVTDAEGRSVVEVRRLGKQVAIGVEGGLWLVLHLKIAGRLHWREPGKKLPGKALGMFEFDSGSLVVTEAGSQHRASLHVAAGEEGLQALDAGGIEVLEATLDEFAAALTRENHTLKRALTDPRAFSGIGNAYSDEILHFARLSPVALTQKLTPDEIARLHAATRHILTQWIDRLRAEAAGAFPEKVTAFHKEMAVHGRYGQPCPACGAPVQRIRHAANEVNYCPRCQTGGKLLADRGLSRLLHQDWPRTLEDLDELRRR
jgi:formamidopyrimidine-DNA glycosylase